MKRLYLIFLLILPGLSSCEKIFEKPSWKTDMVAPLIKTTLGVSNIIADTSFQEQPDSSLKLVTREELYSLSIDSLVQLEVVPYVKNVKLSTLKLDSQQIVRRVSLGELALAMQANGDPTGAFILSNNGNTVPFVPAISNLTAGPLDVNINQFFEYAEMDNPGGMMDIKLENQLPLNISNAQFELRNKNLGTQVTMQTFTALNKGTSQTKSADLSDKIIEGDLVVNVLDMDLASGVGVKIDTSDAIIITLTIRGIKLKAATAIFPAQDVVDEKTEISLQGLGEVQLTETKILSGLVEAEAYSTAEDSVFFTYKIPSATIGTDTFVMKTVIPPAPPGGTRYKKFTADFSGYTLNLQGRDLDTVNTFYNELKGRIEYTGQLKNLSLSDSIQITVRLLEAIPSYVKGYFGDSTINAGGNVNIDVFKKIESGTLNFESVNIGLVIENNIGMTGTYKINNVNAVNTKTAQMQTLAGYTANGSIAKAIDNGSSSTPVTTPIDLSGSNAVSLLNILPDKINYDVDLSYNKPNGKIGHLFDDFAYSKASLNAYLELELPLSIVANQLVLSDTTDFVSENFKTSVNSGTFSVHIMNGFPLNGDLKMYFLDEGNTVIDSVISTGSIIEAPVNAANRVTQKMPSKMSFTVNETKMQNILRSRKIVFKVKFSTKGITPGSYVKVYSDYEIDFKLVGDFNYTIE